VVALGGTRTKGQHFPKGAAETARAESENGVFGRAGIAIHHQITGTFTISKDPL